MELEGVVQNGVIVLQGECSLPEGSRVRIQPVVQNGQPKTGGDGVGRSAAAIGEEIREPSLRSAGGFRDQSRSLHSRHTETLVNAVFADAVYLIGFSPFELRVEIYHRIGLVGIWVRGRAELLHRADRRRPQAIRASCPRPIQIHTSVYTAAPMRTRR